MLEECIGVPPPVDIIMFKFELSIFFKTIDSCSLKNDSPYLSKISSIFKLSLFSIARSSRKSRYQYFKGSENSSWVSRNMIISGLVVLSFLFLHFYDFWVPEMQYKYINFLPEDPNRYYEELVHKFHNPVRVGLYVISFIFLSLHLLHGFSSSFQSVGTDRKYANQINILGKIFAIVVPFGFAFIAIYHHLMH